MKWQTVPELGVVSITWSPKIFANKSNISKTVRDTRHVTMEDTGNFVAYRVDWHQYQWPWMTLKVNHPLFSYSCLVFDKISTDCVLARSLDVSWASCKLQCVSLPVCRCALPIPSLFRRCTSPRNVPKRDVHPAVGLHLDLNDFWSANLLPILVWPVTYAHNRPMTALPGPVKWSVMNRLGC